MKSLAKTFGVAARNFTAYPEMPNAKALVEYGVRVEELGYDSVWVWDHILLGVEPNFPIIDSLTALTGIAARTRRMKIGTGVLVLPLRNPVTLAKQLSSIDHLSEGRLIMGMASGWYKREFDAVGIPFDKRGKLMDENLEIMKRLWTEPKVDGKYMNHNISAAVMYPKPYQKPRMPILIGGYVDKVLQRAATAGRRLAHLFLPPGRLQEIVGQDSRFRQGGRKGSRHAAQRLAASDHGRAVEGGGARRDDGLAEQGVGLSRTQRLLARERHHGHGRRLRRATAGAYSPSACRRLSSFPTSTARIRSRRSHARSSRA